MPDTRTPIGSPLSRNNVQTPIELRADSITIGDRIALQASCRKWLAWALESLGGQPSVQELDEMTELIGTMISVQSRSFHSYEHILWLAEGEDPISTLAALFHDVVYVQVDWGLVPQSVNYFTPFLTWKKGTLSLRPAIELLSHPDSALTASLFGLNHDDVLPADRFNEFLSALLAVLCLKHWLSAKQLAQVVVTIEATIPFRSTVESNPAEHLFSRLLRVNQQFDLGMMSAEIEQSIHRAVKFANRDVESFSFADPVIFLDKTWQLLPELNPALRNPNQYSIGDYRTALRAMESFFLRLDSAQIFQQFHQVPNALTWEALQQRSQHNLEIGRLYLSTKIVAIAILEALLSRRNQKQPVSHWLGPLTAAQWENQFSNLEEEVIAQTLVEQQVLQIVAQGRTRPCQFDLIKSPFTAFLLRAIGFEPMRALRPIAEEFFIGALDSEQFLEFVPSFEQVFKL